MTISRGLLRVLLKWANGIEDEDTDEVAYINDESMQLLLALLPHLHNPYSGRDISIGGMRDGGFYLKNYRGSVWCHPNPDRRNIDVWTDGQYQPVRIPLPQPMDPSDVTSQILTLLLAESEIPRDP
jgi:hypothetical protein